MCGIFGFVVGREAKLSAQSLKEHVVELFLMSESRGKESSGIHLYLPAVGYAWTLKGDIPASELVTTAEFQEMVTDIESRLYKSPAIRPVQPCIILGHSRLVTNGKANLAVNNQPVRAGDVTIVHNGIIVNASEIWESYPHWQRRAQVDTEIAAVLLNDQIVQGRCSVSATQALFQHIKGSASIAWVHGSEPALTLATNTGDLHYVRDVNRGFAVFASELHILRRVALAANIGGSSCISLKAGNGIAIDATNLEADHFQLAARVISPGLRVREDRPLKHYDLVVKKQSAGSVMINTGKPTFELLRYNETSISNLKRCSRCILPETFPFILFDHAGVCNYCQNYKPKYKHLNAQAARDALLTKLSAYRNTNGEPDVLIPFSGGRDSCYGLHLIKKEFGLSPITFTYDWGMVTDLARRNIARMCGILGVPNILVSADIAKKRRNIRQNVVAWLRSMDLGIVPLFMAGDKQFFKIINTLKRQTGINLNIWSSNELENTDFKSGFCGLKPDFEKDRFDYLNWQRKLQLIWYYCAQFAQNPGYINHSLPDTIEAFWSYYIEKREDYFWLFNHIRWSEKEVESTIIDHYEFELAPDSSSTWRIGDGTAPFYNYIYVTARGFSEFDTFRSNQIREGMLSRSQALSRVVEDNRPRVEGLKWYIETIGLEFDTVIARLNELDTMGIHQ